MAAIMISVGDIKCGNLACNNRGVHIRGIKHSFAMTRRDVVKPAFSLRKQRFVKTHALSLLGTKNLHFAKASFPRFSAEAAKLSIIDYLAFYNGKRAHSKLSYESPLEFEREFYKKTA